jgi:hypothetical protein
VNNELAVSRSDELRRALPLVGAAVAQGATREVPSHKDARQEIPSEQLEEAEQDAADPTHEKKIPPENQK